MTFSDQFDPSTTDTDAGFHYAYDLDNNGLFDDGAGDGTYDGSGTNSSQTVAASYLVGPGTHTVAGRIIDKNDGYTDYTTDITVYPLPRLRLTYSHSQPDETGRFYIEVNARNNGYGVAQNLTLDLSHVTVAGQPPNHYMDDGTTYGSHTVHSSTGGLGKYDRGNLTDGKISTVASAGAGTNHLAIWAQCCGNAPAGKNSSW